jgi:hypothetical protein
MQGARSLFVRTVAECGGRHECAAPMRTQHAPHSLLLRFAEFQLDQGGEITELADCFGINLTRPLVQHANGSNAVCSDEYWAAGIEPDSRSLSDKRIVREAGIVKRIWNDEDLS